MPQTIYLFDLIVYLSLKFNTSLLELVCDPCPAFSCIVVFFITFVFNDCVDGVPTHGELEYRPGPRCWVEQIGEEPEGILKVNETKLNLVFVSWGFGVGYKLEEGQNGLFDYDSCVYQNDWRIFDKIIEYE